MIKHEASVLGLQPRQLTYGLIVLVVTAFSAVSLSHILHHCQPCQSAKITLDQETRPNSELRPQPEPIQLEHLPRTEQDLLHKVLETNYSTIWMGPPEVNLLLRYIHGRETYLEWGSGGSTVNFPRWVKKAVSIEHDAGWCSQMKARLAEDDALRHIDYHCVPVKRGNAGWGTKSPFEEGSYVPFKNYVDEIENTGLALFDFILIDGRARVDCAIKALSYINKDSLVVLHDASRVWSGTYNDVQKYYTLINFVGGHGKQGIAIMRRKDEYAKLQGNHQAVQEILYDKYPQLAPNKTGNATDGNDGTDRDGNDTAEKETQPGI